jgi:hypothetical protein
MSSSSITPYSCIASQHLPRNCSQGGSKGNPTTLSSFLPLYGCVSGVRASQGTAGGSSFCLGGGAAAEGRTPMCRRARTSGALPENRADCCARIVRRTRDTYLRTGGILPANSAVCARSVRMTPACPPGRLLARKATSRPPTNPRKAEVVRVHPLTNATSCRLSGV